MKIITLNFSVLMSLVSAEARNNFYFSKNISIIRDSFICPKNIAVGLDARDCYATVKFPIPLAATDSAALRGYEISFPKELNERVRRTNLKGEYPISYTYFPVGDYPIEYFYVDSIEKKIICVMNLSVRDLSPPMVIVREQNEIKLDSSGTKTIAASFFDAGTCDKCSAFDFKVSRKKLNAPEKDWTKISDFVTFTCEDAGDTVLVKLIAIQKRDKFPEVVKNEGISIAIVLENPSAKFICPPHLTVNLSDLKLAKDEMLNYDEQTLQYLDEHFGAVRNLESERKSITV